MMSQKRDVCPSLSEWWQHERDDVQTMVEVLAKLPSFHRFFYFNVRRCDNPHIRLTHLWRTKRSVLLLLEEAQELDLGRERKTVDLIQKKRATFGLVN